MRNTKLHYTMHLFFYRKAVNVLLTVYPKLARRFHFPRDPPGCRIVEPAALRIVKGD